MRYNVRTQVILSNVMNIWNTVNSMNTIENSFDVTI